MPMPIETIAKPMPANSAQTAKAGNSLKTERQDMLKNACRDFESLLIHYMLQQMRQTVPQDGLFRAGHGEKMYTSMMDGEVAKEISRQRGLGLAPMMYHQMIAAINDDPKK